VICAKNSGGCILRDRCLYIFRELVGEVENFVHKIGCIRSNYELGISQKDF
jgi:hypothetical protein